MQKIAYITIRARSGNELNSYCEVLLCDGFPKDFSVDDNYSGLSRFSSVLRKRNSHIFIKSFLLCVETLLRRKSLEKNALPQPKGLLVSVC